MNQKLFWIYLSSLESIARRKIYEVWKRKNELNCQSYKEICQLVGISKEQLEQIENLAYQSQIKRKLEWMEKQKIFCLFLGEDTYPQALKEIYDPPVVLYGKGNKENLNQFSLAIVGCRQYSLYGKKMAYYLSEELSQKEVHIISGLARGIDTFAHEGCLRGKGKTIAVLGNGLDRIYPNENRILAEEILEKKGTILSEYLVGTPPLKFHFPARNRLISGISKGIIVIEAKEKSGTMITVDYGLEQGKNIFAVPGNVGEQNSIGTNRLIQEGAKMVTSIKDILEEY